MRAGLIVIGVIIVALGIWVLAGDLSYQKTDASVKVASKEFSIGHREAVPSWLGIIGLALGSGLLLGGILTRH